MDLLRVILSELEDLFGESKDLSGRDAIFCVSAYHGYISVPVSLNVDILRRFPPQDDVRKGERVMLNMDNRRT